MLTSDEARIAGGARLLLASGAQGVGDRAEVAYLPDVTDGALDGTGVRYGKDFGEFGVRQNRALRWGVSTHRDI